MPLFKFKVTDAAGTVSELLIEGENQTDATRRLQRRGLLPLEFLGEGTRSQQNKSLFGPKLDVVEFTDRLVPLLEANIPLEKALGIVGESQDNPVLQQTVLDLRRGLHEGRKLSDLIRERGREFPQLYAGLVEAGEEAGALPQVMSELRNFLLESRELKSFIISSSIYPAFICVTGIILLAIVMGVIVPKFATALAGAGIKSSSTDFLMALSNILRSYWWVVFVIAALIGYCIYQIRDENGKIRHVYDSLILKVPLAKNLVLYSNISRLCRTMAILMRNGVHLLNTVAIANRVLQNQTIKKSIVGLSGELRQGQKLSTALANSPYIPQLMLRMLAVGEETGSVEVMLERVADRYEADMKGLIKRMLSLFEPMIIVLLGLSVGSVVTIMFMAIMDMQGAAG